MAGLIRPQKCVIPCTDTQRIQTPTLVSCGRSNLSVSSTGIQVSNRTPRIYMSCKKGKAHSSVFRNSPVSRRLVVKSKCKTPVSSSNQRTHPNCSGTQLCDKVGKIPALAN